MFDVFYLQINVFIIYGPNIAQTSSLMTCVCSIVSLASTIHC